MSTEDKKIADLKAQIQKKVNSYADMSSEDKQIADLKAKIE